MCTASGGCCPQANGSAQRHRRHLLRASDECASNAFAKKCCPKGETVLCVATCCPDGNICCGGKCCNGACSSATSVVQRDRNSARSRTSVVQTAHRVVSPARRNAAPKVSPVSMTVASSRCRFAAPRPNSVDWPSRRSVAVRVSHVVANGVATTPSSAARTRVNATRRRCRSAAGTTPPAPRRTRAAARPPSLGRVSASPEGVRRNSSPSDGDIVTGRVCVAIAQWPRRPGRTHLVGVMRDQLVWERWGISTGLTFSHGSSSPQRIH